MDNPVRHPSVHHPLPAPEERQVGKIAEDVRSPKPTGAPTRGKLGQLTMQRHYHRRTQSPHEGGETVAVRLDGTEQTVLEVDMHQVESVRCPCRPAPGQG